MISYLRINTYWRAIFFFLAISAMNSSDAGTTHHVTTTNDNDSPGSLRYEIEHAMDGDTIDFTLTGCPCAIYVRDQITVSKSVSIEGPGPKLLALDGTYTRIIFGEADFLSMANLTVRGGAVDTAVQIYDGTVHISNVTFVGNTFGALGISYGSVQVSNSLFQNNISGSLSGHAIYQTESCDGCSLLVINSSFVGNEAPSCAAIYTKAHTVIENDTFEGNTTVPSDRISSDGGAICFGYGGGEIRNSTFVNNRALGEGGALKILGGTPVSVTNSVFAFNQAESGPNISGAIASWGHNLVTDRTGSYGYQKATCDPLSSGLFPADLPEQDPKLAPLHISDITGLPIVTPNPGSPLIDAISAGSNHCDGIDVPKTDARGTTRPQGVGADIGAIEFISNDDRIFCSGIDVLGCTPLR